MYRCSLDEPLFQQNAMDEAHKQEPTSTLSEKGFVGQGEHVMAACGRGMLITSRSVPGIDRYDGRSRYVPSGRCPAGVLGD
jgi:hypothetical protein